MKNMFLIFVSSLLIAPAAYSIQKEEMICGYISSDTVSFVMATDDGENVKLRVESTWSSDTLTRLQEAVGSNTCVSGYFLSSNSFAVESVN